MDIDVSYVAAESWDERMQARMRRLQKDAPIYWSEKDQLWVLTRFEDVAYVSKHQELFTSAEGVRPGNLAKLGLVDEGEPRHGQLRSLINKGFTPRMVKKLEGPFLEMTTEAIDSFAARGECDFVKEFAVPLPLLLIAEMIGIRKEDRDRFHRWSDDMIHADGRHDDVEIMTKASLAFMEYSKYVGEIIDDRRRNPQDDLVSILVGAKDAGTLGEFGLTELPSTHHRSEEHLKLANDELTMMLVLLMVAGNETTRNGISGGLQLLIENPDQRQKLVEDPSLIPDAVEEMIRLVSPVHSFSRTVTRDTDLRGQALRKGQRVLMLYPAANRDPDVFEDPDEFRIDRKPLHVGFGLGSHFCLGANLARMEMRVAFRELLRRVPDMEYSGGGPVIHPAALVRSCVEMKVRFTPES